MKITEITVSAGRTFNNPYEQYANLRPAVELRATLEEGEEPLAALKKLQEQAETLVEHHKARLLADLDKLHSYTERTRDIARLEDQIGKAQAHLDELKKEQSDAGPLQLTVMDDSEILF
jgi:chromosome segregation ATPase